MRIACIVLLVAGCAREHEVNILLGPTSDSVTVGFLCRADAVPHELLFSSAVNSGRVEFNLVVDLVGFQGRYPGCRGEELVKACPTRESCDILLRPIGKRFCTPLHIEVADVINPDVDIRNKAVRDTLTEQLNNKTIFADAPDIPVLVRAVATTQACAEIENPVNGAYPDLNAMAAVGCAYSCPVLLDEVRGTLSLSLDALSDQCEMQVRICAAFPHLYVP